MKNKIVSLVLAAVMTVTLIPGFSVGAYSYTEVPQELELVTNVVTKFNGTPYTFPVLKVDEYPSMEIGNLATVIGASCSGNTLSKGDVTLTFEAGSRLATYNGGHLILEREAVEYQGALYVPISSLMTTFCYHVEFWRFDDPPTIEITGGVSAPATEVILHVEDYGAVGDGVRDDKDALLRAFAAAKRVGRPVELIFEENKTYRVSERQDFMNFFQISGVNNLTLNGNGSTILFETPTNSLIYINNCKNVTVKNLRAQYEEHTSTQGVVQSVNENSGTFRVRLDNGYALLPPNEWVTSEGDGWGFTQLIVPSGEYVKPNVPDVLFISGVTYRGGREYDVSVPQSYRSYLQYCEVGDRVAFKTNPNAYNLKGSSKPGSPNAISIRSSADVTVENVDVCGSLQFAVEVGLCTGRITLRGLNMPRINGNIETTNSDGIHAFRSRGGLLVENCVLETNFDDQGNVLCNRAYITDRIDTHTFNVDLNQSFMPGDELVFLDPETNECLGTAFLRSFTGNHAGGLIVVDREISGVRAKNTDNTARPCVVWNVNACSRGTVVRNNTFVSSRRYAFLFRAPNSLFENNQVINSGGGLAAMNEVTESWDEGPFPSALTVRGNYFEGTGNTFGKYPIEVKVWGATAQTTPYIDGVLIENNIIDVANKDRMISIDSVRDLYMINNTIRATKGSIQSTTKPVWIKNSEIKMIDGISYEVSQYVSAIVNASGCQIDSGAIRNITKPSGNWSGLTKIN